MGLQNGTVSMTRYRTVGAKDNYTLTELNKKLKSYQAKPLKAQGVFQEDLSGWVRPINLDDQEEIASDGFWDMSDCQIEGGYLLRFRIEKRRVPRQLYQILFKEELEKRALEQAEKPLSRHQRKTIMEELKQQLLGCCLPAIKHVDALWREKGGDILLFSTSSGDRKVFEVLFKETFSRPLDFNFILELPPILAIKNEEESRQRCNLLRDILPSIFVGNAGEFAAVSSGMMD